MRLALTPHFPWVEDVAEKNHVPGEHRGKEHDGRDPDCLELLVVWMHNAASVSRRLPWQKCRDRRRRRSGRERGRREDGDGGQHERGGQR